jgi:hypothetical protein
LSEAALAVLKTYIRNAITMQKSKM